MDFEFKKNGILRRLSILDTHAEFEIIKDRYYKVYLDRKFITNANRNRLKNTYIKGGRIQVNYNDKVEDLKFTVAKYFTKFLHDEIDSINFKDGDLFNCRFSNLDLKIKEPVCSVIFESTDGLEPQITINKNTGWSKKVFYKNHMAILEFYKLSKDGIIVIQSLFDKDVIDRLNIDSITLDYRKSQLDRNKWRVKYLKQKIHRYILDAPKDLEVDHLDRNPLNNRVSNIRLCDHRTNILNQDVSVRSNTGFKGIQFYFHSKTKKKYIRIAISSNGHPSYKFIDPLNYRDDLEALKYAQFIRLTLEKENKYTDICSHEGSETIES